MFEDRIKKLITEDEDEFHDFKLEWYTKHQKDEMIKDIFSFVNTYHHENCYIIIGVRDNDHEIIGVEKDENRLTTDKLTNYLSALPIANQTVPNVRVKSIKINGHCIDVIIIKNTNDVPVYLKDSYHPKACKNRINAGQIFCRLNDVETSIKQTASDYQVSRLWQKRFGLDLPINKRYQVKLQDVNNWEYFENDKVGFRYNIDPNYYMYLEDDDQRRNIVESYSLNQLKIKIDWQVLKIMYRGQLLKDFMTVWLDGDKFLTLLPSVDALNMVSNHILAFPYFIKGTLNYSIENFLLTNKINGIHPDNSEKSNLLKDIVIFEDENQKELVHGLLKNKIEDVRKSVEPSVDQLSWYKIKLKSELNQKELKFFNNDIEIMCREQNLAEYINNFIKTELDTK